jgi:hypothetical protein
MFPVRNGTWMDRMEEAEDGRFQSSEFQREEGCFFTLDGEPAELMRGDGGVNAHTAGRMERPAVVAVSCAAPKISRRL